MKNKKAVSLRCIDKPPENPITHFTVSIFLKSGKEIVIDDVRAIEVNTQAGLLVIKGKSWTEVYPISNINHYKFAEHREEAEP